MKLTDKEKNALEIISKEQEASGKINNARAEKMLKYYEGRDVDSGWYGRIVELSSHTGKSRKIRVAKQGKADTHIKLEKNGKIRYLPCEVKTNGGRISSLYEKNAPKFVIYSMNVSNSLCKEPRIIPPVVIKTSDFLQLLEDCNAIKNTNGKNDELAIQAISKQLYQRLLDYPILYDENAIYTEDDFEGLEI